MELTGKSERDITPSKGFLFPRIDDHQLREEDWEKEGDLASILAKVLMMALYGARTCRWDLLHSINTLAREVTKWNKTCDIRLHKLMCYIRATLTHSLEAFCGDPPELLKLMV